MGWQEINIKKYISEVKSNLNISVSDEIIKKDIILTFILAELEKAGLGKELIFKGGTLLSRNYLNYHRFSEDLDFVFKDSNSIRELTRRARERKVKTFLDSFVPKLKFHIDCIIAYCHLRGEERTFVIERINSAAILNERYTIPKGWCPESIILDK